VDAGRVLLEARLRAGLTQEELGRRAGVPRSVVARIENRGRVPKVDTLDRLLEPCGLGLSVESRLGLAVNRGPIRELLALRPVGRIRRLHDEVPDFHPARILQILAGRKVRFVLLGALAERSYGSPAPSDAVEICVARERWNGQRLRLAIQALTRGRFVSGVVRWRWTVPRPLTYPQLERAASVLHLGSHSVLVAALDDLIAMRRTRGYREDLGRMEVLAAVREERDRLALRRRRPAG
jgi:transcriptional regulator with XRE-family HTH domain